jgi:hypothetical protein
LTHILLDGSVRHTDYKVDFFGIFLLQG